jgi:HEXXH motif-containing protein
MHLQLSLLERCVPLITPADAGFQIDSPWKRAEREAGGILHALYVFRVIEQFWRGVAAVQTDPAVVEFARTRCAEICEETKRVSNFASCPALTDEGQKLVERLSR